MISLTVSNYICPTHVSASRFCDHLRNDSCLFCRPLPTLIGEIRRLAMKKMISALNKRRPQIVSKVSNGFLQVFKLFSQEDFLIILERGFPKIEPFLKCSPFWKLNGRGEFDRKRFWKSCNSFSLVFTQVENLCASVQGWQISNWSWIKSVK